MTSLQNPVTTFTSVGKPNRPLQNRILFRVTDQKGKIVDAFYLTGKLPDDFTCRRYFSSTVIYRKIEMHWEGKINFITYI